MTGLVAAGASELEAKLNGFVRENRLPGAAAGVVHGDLRVEAHDFGARTARGVEIPFGIESQRP